MARGALDDIRRIASRGAFDFRFGGSRGRAARFALYFASPRNTSRFTVEPGLWRAVPKFHTSENTGAGTPRAGSRGAGARWISRAHLLRPFADSPTSPAYSCRPGVVNQPRASDRVPDCSFSTQAYESCLWRAVPSTRPRLRLEPRFTREGRPRASRAYSLPPRARSDSPTSPACGAPCRNCLKRPRRVWIASDSSCPHTDSPTSFDGAGQASSSPSSFGADSTPSSGAGGQTPAGAYSPSQAAYEPSAPPPDEKEPKKEG